MTIGYIGSLVFGMFTFSLMGYIVFPDKKTNRARVGACILGYLIVIVPNLCLYVLAGGEYSDCYLLGGLVSISILLTTVLIPLAIKESAEERYREWKEEFDKKYKKAPEDSEDSEEDSEEESEEASEEKSEESLEKAFKEFE